MSDNDSNLPPLLRMIAHDLRGLLGTPGLLLHLAETGDDADRERYYGAMRESFRALDRMVNDLGDVGHAVAGTNPTHREPTDVRGLLEGALASARAAAELRQIEVVADVAAGPWPTANAEPIALTRAIERLVYWGIAHTASASRFAVAARVEDGSVVIEVPAGAGGPEAVPTVRERLAEIADGARNLGVSLPLAREAIERHGGTLVLRADRMFEARLPLGR
jgi:signal transduction histidine kinase